MADRSFKTYSSLTRTKNVLIEKKSTGALIYLFCKVEQTKTLHFNIEYYHSI